MPHNWNNWISGTGTFVRISLNINTHINQTAFLILWCACQRSDTLQVIFWVQASSLPCFSKLATGWDDKAHRMLILGPLPEKFCWNWKLVFPLRKEKLPFPKHLWCTAILWMRKASSVYPLYVLNCILLDNEFYMQVIYQFKKLCFARRW